MDVISNGSWLTQTSKFRQKFTQEPPLLPQRLEVRFQPGLFTACHPLAPQPFLSPTVTIKTN